MQAPVHTHVYHLPVGSVECTPVEGFDSGPTVLVKAGRLSSLVSVPASCLCSVPAPTRCG
jgi:hypothetical protein